MNAIPALYYRMACIIVIALWLPAGPVLAQHTNLHFNGKGKHTYMHKDDDYSLVVELEGKIYFDEADRAVTAMSEGAELEIEEEKNGVTHFVRIEGVTDDALEYTYRRNGKRMDFEADGRAWFSDILPHVLRETGIGAEQRVARLLKSGGVSGVLDEIELIRSNSGKKRYFNHLFDQAKLNVAELKRAAGIAGAMTSSGDKKRFLISHADAYFKDAATHGVYFGVAESIKSSGDRKRVLIHLAEAGHLKDAEVLNRALRVTNAIPSSGDKSRVLKALAPMAVRDAVVKEAFFNVTATVQSSGDKSRVLKSVLEMDNLDKTTLMHVLHTAGSISSSGDKSRVLIKAADQVAGDDALVDVYLEIANSIGSSGDQKRALSALMR